MPSCAAAVTPLPWGRLFALEVAAFLTLGLLAAMKGNSLLRAESGADGGRDWLGTGHSVLAVWENVAGHFCMFVSWLLAVDERI